MALAVPLLNTCLLQMYIKPCILCMLLCERAYLLNSMAFREGNGFLNGFAIYLMQYSFYKALCISVTHGESSSSRSPEESRGCVLDFFRHSTR